MNDDEILNSFWSRNPYAVIAVKEKYESECYKLAIGILEKNTLADNAVSEAFKTAWNEIPPNRPKELRVFLLGLTRSVAINLLFSEQAATNEKIEQIKKEIAYWSLDTSFSAAELGTIIDSFLRSLTNIEQMIFVCRYWYFDSVDTISRNMKLSEAKIRSALQSMGRQLLLRFTEVEDLIVE